MRFLTGIVVSTGPITVPLFSAYGLVKGSFIATEAAASLTVSCQVGRHLCRSFGALPPDIILKGLPTGSSLISAYLWHEARGGAAQHRDLPAAARRRDA